jgi:predicted lysophospholipase L1 biosynthesis ABC-type transport system permease subunit
MLNILRWIMATLNAGLIICAIGVDVTAQSWPWPRQVAAILITIVSVAMLPYFWLKTRPESET